jgi:5-methylcytosine-specific restriction endonuclease McrA
MKTEEAKERLGNLTFENLSGSVQSRELVEKRSKSIRAFWGSEEGEREKERAGERTSKCLTDIIRSEEFKEKVSEGSYNYWNSPEGLARRSKLSDSMRGELHPNWKGGFSRRNGPDWRATREYVIIRDSYTCQGCGLKGNLSSLEAHHIDGDTYNLSIMNLITVCHLCNIKASVKAREEYWYNFYTKKVLEVEKIWKEQRGKA